MARPVRTSNLLKETAADHEIWTGWQTRKDWRSIGQPLNRLFRKMNP